MELKMAKRKIETLFLNTGEIVFPSKIEIDGDRQNIARMVFLPKGYKFEPLQVETIEWNCKGFLGYKK